MSARKNASLIFIFITILVDVIGLGIIIPVIPSLIQSLMGGDLSEASFIGGWLLFAFSIMSFFFAPVLGELSDHFGRKPVLLIALFGLGLDYIFHAFAPSIFWLFVGRVLAGIMGASFSVANAYVADISKPEEKAKNFGMMGAAFGLGFIIGPAMGGIVAESFGVKAPFLLAAALSLLNLTYGLFVLPESLPVEKRRKFDWRKANPRGSFLELKKYPLLIGFAAAFFLIHLAGHAVQSTWTFFSMLKFSWTEADIGYSLGFVGIMVVLVQAVLVGWFVKTLGNQRTVIIGFVLWGVGMLTFAFAEYGWMLYLGIIPYTLGGIAGPTVQGIMSNQFPDTEQGELQGALTSLIALTSIIGPVLMTSIFSYFTQTGGDYFIPGAPFILGTVFAGLSLWLVIRALGTLRKSEIRPE